MYFYYTQLSPPWRTKCYEQISLLNCLVIHVHVNNNQCPARIRCFSSKVTVTILKAYFTCKKGYSTTEHIVSEYKIIYMGRVMQEFLEISYDKKDC